MKTQKLFVIVALVCLMAFLSVSTFPQKAQAQPAPSGSVAEMAELLAQMLAAEGYDMKLDDNKLTIRDRIMLEMPSTLEESEDSGIRAHLVPQADNFAEYQALDIGDIQDLRKCLNAADLNFEVTTALCELYTTDAGDFICKTEATFDRILSSIKCVALYVPQEPDVEDVSVFVTERRYRANLGGLAGADRKCQRRAEAAGLTGTWTAWLSAYPTQNAIDRIPEGQYIDMHGAVIASDKAELTSGLIRVPIRIDENGNTIKEGRLVWTGTTSSGVTDQGADCGEWTSAGEEDAGTYGSTTNRDWPWTAFDRGSCQQRFSLYCFGGLN